MVKPTNKKNEEVEILQRLDKLEIQLKEHDDTEKKLRFISLGGIFLILIFLGLFVFRLVNYIQNYKIQSVVEYVKADVGDYIKPELDMFVTELRSELLPIFFDNLTAEFKNSEPEIREAIEGLGNSLEIELRRLAEERLLDSIITSLENSGEEIKDIFPEFSAVNLEKQIGKSMEYYVEKLHDAIEHRVAMVAASLRDLKTTAEEIGGSEKLSQFGPQNNSDAEEQLINSLLDLIVYEIKPDIGSQTAR